MVLYSIIVLMCH